MNANFGTNVKPRLVQPNRPLIRRKFPVPSSFLSSACSEMHRPSGTAFVPNALSRTGKTGRRRSRCIAMTATAVCHSFRRMIAGISEDN